MIKSKTIKLLLSVITVAMTLFLMCGLSVSANTKYLATIIDDCGVLSESEVSELTSYLEDCSQIAEINIAVVITDKTDKNGVTDYADILAEELFGSNSDNVLYLINMYDNYDWLSCSGKGIEYYPQSTIDYILSSTSGVYLMDSENLDFYNDITTFGDLAISERSLPISYGTIVVISFVMALIISLITCLIIASKYKFHSEVSADVYTKNNDGGIVFTQRKDMFIKTYTTKTPRSKDSGTSTHTSSSGGTHSGGGFQR